MATASVSIRSFLSASFTFFNREHLPGARAGRSLGAFRHTITHHQFTFTVRAAAARASGPSFRWFLPPELVEVPLSTTARKALKLAGIL